MTSGDRITGLDMLRGLAVVLMVFGHCVSWGDYGDAFAPYQQVGWALTGFRMPMLFLISGVLAGGLLSAGWRTLVRRMAHFAWIYAVWTPIVLIFVMAFMQHALATVGWDTFAAELLRPLTVMWFIWVLAIHTIALFMLRGLPRSLVALAAISTSVIGYAASFEVFSHGNLLRHAGFFFVGALYRNEAMRLVTMPFSWRLTAALVATLVPLHAAAQALRATEGWQILGVPERFVLCAIGLHCIQLARNLPIAAPLARIGRRTLPIFVAHLPILLLIRMILPDLGSVLAPVALTAASIAGSLIVERIAIRSKAGWLYGRPEWMSARSARRIADLLPIPAAMRTHRARADEDGSSVIAS